MKFRAGDFSLDDAPQSGRPVEVGSDPIKTLIENNQCYTTREKTDIFKISKAIKLLTKMKMSFILWKKTKQTFWPTQNRRGCPRGDKGQFRWNLSKGK